MIFLCIEEGQRKFLKNCINFLILSTVRYPLPIKNVLKLSFVYSEQICLLLLIIGKAKPKQFVVFYMIFL
jgi:hypothetical protein